MLLINVWRVNHLAKNFFRMHWKIILTKNLEESFSQKFIVQNFWLLVQLIFGESSKSYSIDSNTPYNQLLLLT